MIPSVVARLERSEVLVADLYRRCQEWSVNNPPTISVERGEDGLATWFADNDAEPSIDLAVTAGEITHHLRACLDHTVWALVESAGGEPGRHTQFPIEAKPKAMTTALKGVHPAAQQVVRDAQIDGAHPVPALAGVLALSNLDKHRSLYASQATAVSANASVRFRHDDAIVRKSEPIFPGLPAYTSPGERRWILKFPLPEGADLDELATYADVSWHHDVEFYAHWENLRIGGPSKAFGRMISEFRTLLVRFDPYLHAPP